LPSGFYCCKSSSIAASMNKYTLSVYLFSLLNTRYCCTAGGLGAKVVRNDSLAKFLSTGRQRREQQDRSILPQRTEAERKEFRQAIGTQLNRYVTPFVLPILLFIVLDVNVIIITSSS